MLLLHLISIYLASGILFSVPFLAIWIHQLDESTQHTSWSLKITLLPGSIVFWPILLQKVIRLKSGSHD